MTEKTKMGRPVGSFGAKTIYWRGLLTNEHIDKAYNTLIRMLDSDDPKDQQWAVKMLMDKFHISAERMLEVAVEQNERITTKEEFEELKRLVTQDVEV